MASAIILIITLVLTLTLFTFMSPIKRCTQARRPSIVEIAGPAPIYIPEVLKPRTAHNATPLGPHSYNGAGTSVPAGNGNGGGYGSDSVSDFDISSQCSVNSVEA